MEQFPLVGDDELMITAMPQMNLYDESDLISNIQGDYVDRTYVEWDPIVAGNPAAHTVSHAVDAEQEAPQIGKTYAELAREQARADLKKKRSAAYLRSESTPKIRKAQVATSSRRVTRQENEPTAYFQKEEAGELIRLGQNLKQDHYILAELDPPQALEEVSPTPKKNSYDFLKRSQIYNPKKEEPQAVKRAQELNMTSLEQG